MSAHFARQA